MTIVDRDSVPSGGKATSTRVVPISCADTAAPAASDGREHATAAQPSASAARHDRALDDCRPGAGAASPSSKVSDAQKLDHWLSDPADAGTMWTALISQAPGATAVRSRRRIWVGSALTLAIGSSLVQRDDQHASERLCRRTAAAPAAGSPRPAAGRDCSRQPAPAGDPNSRSRCDADGGPRQQRATSRNGRTPRASRRSSRRACAAQRGNRLEPLFREVLIELRGLQHDRARLAVITDDEEARRTDAHQARRIGAVAADHRSRGLAVDHDEALDQAGSRGSGSPRKSCPTRSRKPTVRPTCRNVKPVGSIHMSWRQRRAAEAAQR